MLRASGSKIKATIYPKEIREADLIIICVPTLVTKAKDQDLGSGHECCTKRGGESERRSNRSSGTVYPGVTKGIVVPILEQESAKRYGKGFCWVLFGADQPE